MSGADGPPNVVVVVLDCVRADDFASRSAAVGPLPFFDALRAESVVYPRAASVAPWTLPAHATLFTGLYPWEHEAHAKGKLPLGAQFPRLAGLLRAAGYRSLSLSANPLLNDDFGMVEEFDASAWSDWWEPYLRTSKRAYRARPLALRGAGAATPSSALQKIHDSPLVSLLHQSADLVYRYPFVLDAVNRVVRRTVGKAPEPGAFVAPWIDPTLDRWLGGLPPETPAFAFVNLLEAHEPYFLDPGLIRGWRAYLDYAKTWQDRPAVLAGRWTPNAREVAMLRALYRSTFRLLERRVRGIVDLLKAHDRWENTVFVLTSDHGQAFLEQGTLFHMHRADEGLLRIPLWVRYPHGARGGTVAKGWASLVDVAPTVLTAAQVPVPEAMTGRNLLSLEQADRPTPLDAMADGLVLEQERRNVVGDRMAWIDRLWVASYQDDRKVTLDVTSGATAAYDLATDPGERTNLWATERARFDSLYWEAQRVGHLLAGGGGPQRADGLEERLRSWGYI